VENPGIAAVLRSLASSARWTAHASLAEDAIQSIAANQDPSTIGYLQRVAGTVAELRGYRT
jgi:hypothetical protein